MLPPRPETHHRLTFSTPFSKQPDPGSLLAASPMNRMPADRSPLQSRNRPAPLACYSCRSKHLKCGGASPMCSRCSSIGAICTYLPSRRGRSARTCKSHAPRPSNPVHYATPLPVEENPERNWSVSEIGQQDSRGDSTQTDGRIGEDYSCNVDWFDFFASVDVDHGLLQHTSIS